MINSKKSKFYNKVVSYDEILSLISLAQKGDLKSKNKLIKLNIGLVKKAVSKFSFSSLDNDDLYQLGCIGLVKAIERFDPALGNMFSSYAVPLIEGEIKRFLRDDGIIKISRELKTIGWKAKKYKTQYFKKTGKEASLQALSKELNIPIEKIQSALIALSPVEYFNIYESDSEYTQLDLSNNIIMEDSIPYTELIELNEIIDELPDLEKKVFNIYESDSEYTQLDLSNNIIMEDSIPYTELIELNEIIDELPDLEKKVMKLRYFEDFTQAKTGEILGISQVQVSRIERKALMLLKKEYTN